MKSDLTKAAIRQILPLVQTLFNPKNTNELAAKEIGKLASLAKQPQLDRLDLSPQHTTEVLNTMKEAEESKKVSIYY